MQTQVNNALSELSKYEGNNLLGKIQDIKTKQSNLTADLDEANTLNTSMDSQLNTANTQLLSLQHQIDILTGQLNDKDAQITELLELIAKKDAEFAGKNIQISNLQSQVQTLQITIDSLSYGDDSITKLTQQVKNLTSQIIELNVKVSELTVKIAGKDTLINNLNGQLDAKTAEISKLQKQIEELLKADGSQNEIIKLQDEITKLTSKLDKAKDVISNLKQLEEGSKVSGKLNAPVFMMYKKIYLGYDYRVQLSNTNGYEVSLRSSNNKVAKVNKNGMITSIKKGKAVITCTVGNSYIYKIVVTVADGKGKATLNLIAPKIQTTGCTPVLLMYKQVKKGSSTKLKISGLDKKSEVTYVNVNTKVAVISKDGTISGISKGSTDVLAIVTQGNLHYIYYVKIRVDDATVDADMWEYLTAF